MSDILYKEESFAIVGACFAVYNELGSGFLEGIYHECLALEFRLRGIPFLSQPTLGLVYRDQPICQTFRPDFICYDSILLEIKAVSELANEHRAQLHNYMKVAKIRLGLLINFCAYPKLLWERVIR